MPLWNVLVKAPHHRASVDTHNEHGERGVAALVLGAALDLAGTFSNVHHAISTGNAAEKHRGAVTAGSGSGVQAAGKANTESLAATRCIEPAQSHRRLPNSGRILTYMPRQLAIDLQPGGNAIRGCEPRERPPGLHIELSVGGGGWQRALVPSDLKPAPIALVIGAYPSPCSNSSIPQRE